MSYIGFDWLVIDTEHAPHSLETVENLIRTIERTDVVPMVRVGWNDPTLLKWALDRGAMGVVIPWVNSREEAEKAVRSCMFPPRGLRGIGGGRTTKYDLDGGLYMREANDSILVVVQIETEQAVNSIDEILSVDGIGAAFVGPADLSASLGIPGRLDDERFQAALARILKSGKEHGVPVGIHLGAPDRVARMIEQGWQFMAIAEDLKHAINGARAAFDRIAELCGDTVGLSRKR